MRYSLLYSDRSKDAVKTEDNFIKITDPSVKTAIYDLNVDRAVRLFCKNNIVADYFLSVISEPLATLEDIRHRNGILCDLQKSPELLEGLFSVLKGYDSLRDETEELNGGIFRYGSSESSSAMLDCAYERAYISAHFVRNVIAYIYELDALLSGFELNSTALKALSSFCAEVSGDPLIKEVERGAELFRHESVENYRFRITLFFDSLLRLEKAELVALEQKKKEKFNPLAALKHKKREDIPSFIDIGSSAADNIDFAAAGALERLAESYESLANGLYERLFGMSEELKFYRAALDVAAALKNAGLPLCVPEMLSADCDVIEATGICDILLLNEGKDAHSIVPNDICISGDKDGVLVRGDNNCGKTSFLRSVGCAQLFAQAGLFVCATSFRASIRYGIFSHFSSAEKEFTDNDAAGRFEGEVKDIAAMLRALRPYSLVLLNETFQTTAYSEGAEGMKLILDALPLAKTKYIFVTHIISVFKAFGNERDRIVALCTGENGEKYKLVPFSQAF